MEEISRNINLKIRIENTFARAKSVRERIANENKELKFPSEPSEAECLAYDMQYIKQYIEQLEKENKELKGKYNIQPVLVNNSMFFIDNELYENLLVDINKNYIPKSVIRDKIEELYNKQDKEDEILSDKGFDLGMRNYLTTKEVTIKVLKEILGDE